jgi:hypothetical protein
VNRLTVLLTILCCHLSHYQKQLVELYTKLVLGSRVSLPRHVVTTVSKLLLKCVTHDSFKEDCLPAIERAMLRNPEIILEGTIYIYMYITLLILFMCVRLLLNFICLTSSCFN